MITLIAIGNLDIWAERLSEYAYYLENDFRHHVVYNIFHPYNSIYRARRVHLLLDRKDTSKLDDAKKSIKAHSSNSAFPIIDVIFWDSVSIDVKKVIEAKKTNIKRQVIFDALCQYSDNISNDDSYGKFALSTLKIDMKLHEFQRLVSNLVEDHRPGKDK